MVLNFHLTTFLGVTMDEAKKAVAKGKSMTDFRAAHDKDYYIPLKIKQGLAELGEGWEYELNFVRICGLSGNDLSRYRDEFTDYTLITPGAKGKRVWSGSKATIVKMKEML